MKRGNGVTLIALAVTIIVMLILAGVTISTLTGNSGITTKASKAKTKSYLANIKEEYELYLSEKRMDDEYDLDILYANDKKIRYEGKIKTINQRLLQGWSKLIKYSGKCNNNWHRSS